MKTRTIKLAPIVPALALAACGRNDSVVRVQNLNGCDPSVPPVLVSELLKVPTTVYGALPAEEDADYDFEAFFYWPRETKMTMRAFGKKFDIQTDATRTDATKANAIELSYRGLYRATFIFKEAGAAEGAGKMYITLHPPVGDPIGPLPTAYSIPEDDIINAAVENESVPEVGNGIGLERFKVRFKRMRTRFYLADENAGVIPASSPED